MKKVAVYLKLPQITDYPLSDPSYFQAYLELGKAVMEQGGEYYIVRGQQTYLGKGRFSNSWQYQNDQLVETGELVADVVFDRGEFATDGLVKTLNEEFVNYVCTNKWLTYNMFKEVSPRSWLVNSTEQLTEALQEVKTELGVVKPIDGQEGKDVYIDKVSELSTKPYQYPVLVQEFLDTSSGVPGIVAGMHDFRVAIINGEIIYSYFRTPPAGSFLANVARGGKFEVIDIERIPTEVFAAVKKIDRVMSMAQQRFYGIDFAVTREGVKIIEMNSRMGLIPNADHPVFATLKKRLAEILLSA